MNCSSISTGGTVLQPWQDVDESGTPIAPETYVDPATARAGRQRNLTGVANIAVWQPPS